MWTFFPPEWEFTGGSGRIWVTGLRVFLAADAPRGPVDVLGSRAMFVLLDKSYVQPGTLTVADWQGEGELEFVHEGVDTAASFRGTALLLFTREQGDESSTRAQIQVTVALVRSQLGRNAAYDQCFQYVYSSPSEVTAETNSIENPRSFGVPPLDQDNVQRLQNASVAIESAAEGLRRRAELALQWHFNAGAESGVAGFVYRWVAIEVIGIPTGTNVAPATKLLSDAYGVSVDEARDTFRLGRLQGIRSSVVHEGARIVVAAEVLDYLDALFIDIFEATFKMPLRHLAKPLLTPAVVAFCDSNGQSH